MKSIHEIEYVYVDMLLNFLPVKSVTQAITENSDETFTSRTRFSLRIFVNWCFIIGNTIVYLYSVITKL